jgi:hypothetical protein
MDKMTNHFQSATTKPEQPLANENVSDGAPNKHTYTGEGSVPYGGPALSDENGAEISEKTATGPRTPTRLPRKPDANRNPSGPPKDLPISGSCADLAGKLLPETLRTELNLEDGATFGDALAAVLFAAAIKGNIRAAREIREAIEGRANQRSNRVAAEPIEVLVKYEPPLSQMMPKESPDGPNE